MTRIWKAEKNEFWNHILKAIEFEHQMKNLPWNSTFYTKPAQIQGPSCKISVVSTVFLINVLTGTKVTAVQGGHPSAKILKLCKHG